MGIFIIPIIKEIKFKVELFGFKSGINDIVEDPIDFIKEVMSRTFIGGF